MDEKFSKVLEIVGIVTAWSMKALADGKVSRAEGEELVNSVCQVLGVPLVVDMTPEE